MTDRTCTTCHHHFNDGPLDWCEAPQVFAAHKRRALILHERDGFENEYNREKTGAEKCGPELKNWMRKA